MREQYRVVVAEADRIRAGLAMQLIAVPTGITVEEMACGGRLGLAAGRARWLALYLAHVGFGWTVERVSHAFGLNRATVVNACKWSEDRRDDRDLDRLLNELTELIRTVCEAPKLDLATPHVVSEAA